MASPKTVTNMDGRPSLAHNFEAYMQGSDYWVMRMCEILPFPRSMWYWKEKAIGEGVSFMTKLIINIIIIAISVKYVISIDYISISYVSMTAKLTPLLLLALIALAAGKPIIASKVILALNCGSKDQQVQSLDKTFKYKPDEPFVTGKSVDVDYHSNDEAKETDIKYTFEKRLYMYERHTYDEMTYSLPVKPGKITLILKFAQMYFRNPGERVFNIKIGSKVVRQDLDVVRETGSRYAAHEQFIQIDVQKDGVYFDGTKIPGALSGNKLRLSFAKGKADNPIIQGIIVYHDSLDNSPRAEYRTMKERWQTQKQIQKAMKEEQALKDILAVQKKKEKIVIRNDQLIVEKNQQKTQAKVATEKYGFLRRLAMGPVGILFWSALIAINLQLLYRKVFLISSEKKEKAE